jgi:hypothetical protein
LYESGPAELVRIDKAADLIYLTYFMVDWKTAKQEPSGIKCAECGQPMNRVEPAIDSTGKSYDGFVCHGDKRVIWVKGD